MKNVIITFALLLGFATFSFGQFSHQLDSRTIKNIKTQPGIQISPKFVYQPNCPDLAAYEIQVTKVSGGTYSGRIKISGIIKNVGKKHFVSGTNQATAYLYEVYPGGRKRLLRSMSLRNIPSNRTQTMPAVYKNWYTGNEFPPSYRLVIGYDPDIRLDGNPRNDDCVHRNNQKEVDGTQIHRIFRAGR
ncbi:MAG TPA: hypothetical protein VJ953_21345 [Saprospiraceae bacterium]|nr:hypothetical protein [Saprospiraceae bacterium]